MLPDRHCVRSLTSWLLISSSDLTYKTSVSTRTGEQGAQEGGVPAQGILTLSSRYSNLAAVNGDWVSLESKNRQSAGMVHISAPVAKQAVKAACRRESEKSPLLLAKGSWPAMDMVSIKILHAWKLLDTCSGMRSGKEGKSAHMWDWLTFHGSCSRYCTVIMTWVNS